MATRTQWTPTELDGRGGTWFRRALQRHEGRIRAGGVERDVAFEEPGDADHRAVDDAYRSKYGRYAGTYVEPMVGPVATAATLRLAPAETTKGRDTSDRQR